MQYVQKKTRRKTLIFRLRIVKAVVPTYGNSRANVSFSTCQKMCACRFAWQAWRLVTFHMCEVEDCCGAEVAVPIGKVGQACLCRRVTRCARVVFRCRLGTLCHSRCVRCQTVVMLTLPCLWETSNKRVFFDVSQDGLMWFCVAGVALCDIPCA